MVKEVVLKQQES